MGSTVKQPMVSKSVLSNRYFYFTRHKSLEGGKAIQVVGQRTDVTESVAKLVEQEIGEFLEYVKKTYGLELLDPKPKTEADGQEYLYGVKETTGYEYLNQLVQEWRGA